MSLVVVAVAITGSVPRKRDNPAVPITPAEQIESTREAYEAGATLAHIHVRNDDENSPPLIRIASPSCSMAFGAIAPV